MTLGLRASPVLLSASGRCIRLQAERWCRSIGEHRPAVYTVAPQPSIAHGAHSVMSVR